MFAHRLRYLVLCQGQVVVFVHTGDVDPHRTRGAVPAVHAVPFPREFVQPGQRPRVVAFRGRGRTPGQCRFDLGAAAALRPLRRGASGRIRGIVPGSSGVRRASWRRSAGRLRRRPSSRRWRSLRVRRIRRAVAVRGRCCAAPARNSRPPRAYPRRRSAAAGRNRGSPRTAARR